MSVVINGTTGITSSGGYTGDGLTVADGAPAGAMTLDASGNLGVGITPTNFNFAGRTYAELNGTSQSLLGFSVAGAAKGYVFHDGVSMAVTNAGTGPMTVSALGAHPVVISTNGSERARIDSSGNLLVGIAVSGYQNSNSIALEAPNGYGVFNHVAGTASGIPYVAFGYGGTGVGSITQNGTTAVAYNTSSDYRLKYDIAPMQGALARVAALKPVTYKWNADGSDGDGFIAHELAEVCPQAVTGEKDAVDADGKPVYQGIDTSFLVATLTAAIQELNAKVEAQAAEIAALKGAV